MSTHPSSHSSLSHDAQSSDQLSSEEQAVYDRQLRVWGIEAQQRIRTSHILLIHLTPLAVEIVKNLVLAGIGHITLYDYDIVTACTDLTNNIFIRDTDI